MTPERSETRLAEIQARAERLRANDKWQGRVLASYTINLETGELARGEPEPKPYEDIEWLLARVAERDAIIAGLRNELEKDAACWNNEALNAETAGRDHHVERYRKWSQESEAAAKSTTIGQELLDRLEQLDTDNIDRMSDLTEICGALGLHPDTAIEQVLEQIGHVRQEARGYADIAARVAELEGEVRDSNRCRDTYKQLYNHALDCVDQVFQQCSEIPNPLLPDFAQLGEDKFMAVVRLAKEHIKLTAQLRAAEQERDDYRKAAEVEAYAGDEARQESTALRERSDRLLIWLKWFVGDDNVATALRIATGRGCAEWQLEEIRQLWTTPTSAAKE